MRTKAQLDADRMVDKTAPSLIRTRETPFEVFCGECNRSMFIDAESQEAVKRKAEHGIEEIFICDDCELALRDAELG